MQDKEETVSTELVEVTVEHPVDYVRDAGGRFAAGNKRSGHNERQARIKAAQGDIQELHRLFLFYSPNVFQALLSIIEDKTASASARVSAIKEYNERALGKGNDIAMGKVFEGADDFDLSDATDEDLRIIAKYIKKSSD